jgi:hypothetical protein
MDGKIEQLVCIKFCMKPSKSAAKTFEMLCEAFGLHSLSQTVVFEWHSGFKADRMPVEDDERSGRPSTSKTKENVEKFENSSTKTIAEKSMSLQTPLGSVTEFARQS